MRILIAIPSGDTWHADFAVSVINMIQRCIGDAPVNGMEISLTNYRSSLLVDARQRLAQSAIDKGATHVLFLDSDMVFPEDTIHRLLSHGLPMVGCNYVKRTLPSTPNTTDLNGEWIYTREDSTGLEEAGSAGFGVLLVDVNVYKDTSKPWFDTVWMTNGNLLGEDIFFFRKLAEENGSKLYIDHDLSKEVHHIGTFEYTNAMADIE